MEVVCEKRKCSGCGACLNVCPVNAISMQQDERGFLYPVIDQDKCVNCRKCQTVCGVYDDNKLLEPIKIYACKNKNDGIRGTSSSGGFFYEIAKNIINDNGTVYGAAFNSNVEVEHVKATSLEEVEKIKKSKYVQSNMGIIYESVKEDLKNGKKVLFSGTPCQINAVKNVVGLENLIFLDIVCHGVPSPGIFDGYKQKLEEKYNSKIIDVNFRYKDNRTTQNICVKFENGQEYIANNKDGDEFYNLFFHDLILRRSCYDCKFKSFTRIADISLGDFWGYEKGQAKDFGDNKGVSLVLINTQKGLDLFNKVKNQFDYMEISKEDCIPYNCFSEINYPANTEQFWKDFQDKGYNGIIKYV